MALLVAQTRVESGVHSTLEVAYGGLLGALVTLVALPGRSRMTDDELLERADAVAARAYAPYSRYLVGRGRADARRPGVRGRATSRTRRTRWASAPSGRRSPRAVDRRRPTPGDVEAVGDHRSRRAAAAAQWLHEFRRRATSIYPDGDRRRRARHVDANARAELLPEHAGTSSEAVGVKSGFVAVAGRPNVGKSTLVNTLCGGKVAIVSDKPHTTRRRIFGIANGEDYQLVLVDLPGFQRPLDPLTERMQRTVDESFEDVDAVLLVARRAGADRRGRPVRRRAACSRSACRS